MALSDRLEFILNEELTKRLLIRYFSDKGFGENFDRRVSPPILQDLTEAILELNGKIELVPHAIEMDPTNGFARLGWNLFVLGNQRMYLGETEHANLQDLAQQLDTAQPIVETGMTPTRYTRSARDIVNWITRTLGRAEAGLIRMIDQVETGDPQMLGNSQGTNFYERPKAIRPEGTSQF